MDFENLLDSDLPHKLGLGPPTGRHNSEMREVRLRVDLHHLGIEIIEIIEIIEMIEIIQIHF